MRMGARDVGTSQWRRAAAFLAAGLGVVCEGSAVLLASDFELINPPARSSPAATSSEPSDRARSASCPTRSPRRSGCAGTVTPRFCAT